MKKFILVFHFIIFYMTLTAQTRETSNRGFVFLKKVDWEYFKSISQLDSSSKENLKSELLKDYHKNKNTKPPKNWPIFKTFYPFDEEDLIKSRINDFTSDLYLGQTYLQYKCLHNSPPWFLNSRIFWLDENEFQHLYNSSQFFAEEIEWASIFHVLALDEILIGKTFDEAYDKFIIKKESIPILIKEIEKSTLCFTGDKTYLQELLRRMKEIIEIDGELMYVHFY